MKTLIHIITLFLGSILLSSCVFSKKVNFNNLDIKVKKVNCSSIDIAFIDQRKIVHINGKSPNFAGDFGMLPIYSSSNAYFIDDLSNAVVKSLVNKNIKATKIQSKWNDTEDSVATKMLDSKAKRKIIFNIKQFNTQGPLSQTLMYHIKISIYNQNNNLIFQNSYNDYLTYCAPLNNLRQNSDIGTYIPYLISTLMSDIMEKPEIVNAINE